MDQLTLTRDDVEALRRARGVVFFADSEGRAKVRAYFERRSDTYFTPVEQRIFPTLRWNYSTHQEWEREFRVNGSARVTSGLSEHTSPLDGKRLIGSYFVMSAQVHAPWRTIAAAAREGQAMELRFLADHSTHDNLRRVGYHADDFILRLWTLDEDGGRKKVQEFLVDVGVGPHDSARMIRAEHDVAQLTTSFSIDDFWEEAS